MWWATKRKEENAAEKLEKTGREKERRDREDSTLTITGGMKIQGLGSNNSIAKWMFLVIVL